MNQNDKFQIERETVNHHWALRLKMGCKAICEDKRKRAVVLIYSLVALLLLLVQPWLFIWRGNDVFSVIQRAGMGQLFPVAAVAGLFGLVVLFLSLIHIFSDSVCIQTEWSNSRSRFRAAFYGGRRRRR